MSALIIPCRLQPGFGNPRMVPVGLSEIDWSHLLTNALDGIWVPGSANGLTNIVNDIPATIVSPVGDYVNSISSPNGPGISLHYVGVHIESNCDLKSTGAFTLSGLIVNSNGTGALLGSFNGGREFRLNGGKLNLLQQYTADMGSSITAVATGATAHIGVTYSSSGAYHFYINGIDAGGNGVNLRTFTQQAICLASGALSLGSSSPVDPLSSGTSLMVAHSRELSPAEMFQMAAEPFAMLRPKAPLRTWSIPSGPIRTRPRVMLLS